MLEHLFAFVARHPRAFDVFVALTWAALSIPASGIWGDTAGARYMAISALIGAVALYWRRRQPIACFAVQATLTIIGVLAQVDDPVPGSILCGAYSLGAYAENRRTSNGLIGGFLAFALASVALIERHQITDGLIIALVLAFSWLLGDSLRTRRVYHQSVLERAERAEALRDSLAQQAVAEERARIARDLHDVVAHSMSLMVVQAGAARRIASTDPQASEQALETIESVGRSSLDEMRRILGVLRGEDGSAQTAPQPDLAALGQLIDEHRTAGNSVELRLAEDLPELSPALELTVYRIVQESLTNVRKHAPHATAAVTIDVRDGELHVEIVDDAPTSRTSSDDLDLAAVQGAQRGIVGMRERVAAFGGTFSATALLQGGFQVVAEFPLTKEQQSAVPQAKQPSEGIV